MIPVERVTADEAPLNRRSKWALLAAISGANFVAVFSATAPVAAILPVVADDLQADIPTTTWILTIYQLVTAGLVLTFGRLGDLRGLRFVYVAGCILFVLGSLACGIAPDVTTLIGARALTGVAGAMVFSASPALISRHAAPKERATLLGWFLTISTFGIALGPPVAGFITDLAGWRWVFLGVVPAAIVVMAVSVPTIPRDPPAQSGAFDIGGAAAFLVALSLLLLALNQGESWGWTSASTLGSAAIGTALLLIFVVIELRHRTPMLDLRLFGRRGFSSATIAAVLNYVAMSAVLVLVPVYLINGRRLTTTDVGMYLLTQPIARAVVGPTSGVLADRFGTWAPSAFGMLMSAGGLLILAVQGPTSPLTSIVAALIVTGIGIGLFLSPNTAAILMAAGREQQGMASGVVSTARSLGIGIGVVVSAVAVSITSDGGADAVYRGSSLGFLIAFGCSLAAAAISLLRDPSAAAAG